MDIVLILQGPQLSTAAVAGRRVSQTSEDLDRKSRKWVGWKIQHAKILREASFLRYVEFRIPPETALKREAMSDFRSSSLAEASWRHADGLAVEKELVSFVASSLHILCFAFMPG